MMKQQIFWTEEMDATLEHAAEKMLSRAVTAKMLGMSVPTMMARVNQLGIYWEVQGGSGPKWEQDLKMDLESHRLVMDGVQYADVDRLGLAYQRAAKTPLITSQVNYERLTIRCD